jgi:myo-inositol-1(or 4)-monophosphatase
MNFQYIGPQERKELLRCALKATRLGREVLLHYFGRLEKIEEKFQSGLVSEADKESERVIRAYLYKEFPDFDFVGEESTLDLRAVQSKSNRPRWILDPLDGTTNYIHRFPAFAVSLGLQAGVHLEVGVVDVPMMGEVYSATRDGGAFVNGRKISVSGTTELKNAFLATGFISENEENLEEQLRIFSNMVRKARAIRRAGAAAYDLCLVAKGVFDGYWEKGIKPWDSAAGVLLVREAGGIVQTYRGLEYDPFHNSIVAGTKHVVKAVQGELIPYILPSTN